MLGCIHSHPGPHVTHGPQVGSFYASAYTENTEERNLQTYAFGHFQIIRNLLNQRFYHLASSFINRHLCSIYYVPGAILSA